MPLVTTYSKADLADVDVKTIRDAIGQVEQKLEGTDDHL